MKKTSDMPSSARVDHEGHVLCDGVKSGSYWKGYPCNAYAKYEFKGKMYCGVHYAKAVTEAEKEG